MSRTALVLVGPGTLELDDAEVTALRAYLLNGGFLMLDDFWGEYAWSIKNFSVEYHRTCKGNRVTARVRS